MDYDFGLACVHIQSRDNKPEKYVLFQEQIMQDLIKQYNDAMRSAKNPYEKLKVILKFVQDAERFHPFYDANTRVFSMLVKNYLLVKNGLPPMICDVRPNDLDGSLLDDVISDYIENMETTLLLARKVEPTVPVTKDIVKGLNSEQQTYYAKVMKVAHECGELLKPSVFSTHTLFNIGLGVLAQVKQHTDTIRGAFFKF